MNWLSPKEFAKRFKITRVTVYALIKSGKLPAVKFGNRVWRIDVDEIKPENLINGEGE